MKKKNDLQHQVIEALLACQDKQADDVAVLELEKDSGAFTDYFVMCSGTNPRQIQAIADEVGIDRESLERATAELAQTRVSRLSRQDEAKEIAEERTLQLKRFSATLVSHAIMNGVFYYIDTRFFAGAWFKWPLLGSAIMLTFRLRNVLAPHDRLLSRRRKEERRREKEQRRAAHWFDHCHREGGK